MSIRSERIGEQIRSELARLLREESRDPRIGLVTITRVKVSPDLSSALVFWSPLDAADEEQREEVARGLESARGFLRRQIAHSLSLRRTPALEFRRDDSIEVGSRTLSLLRELAEERDRCSPDDDRDQTRAEDDAGTGEAGDGAKA